MIGMSHNEGDSAPLSRSQIEQWQDYLSTVKGANMATEFLNYEVAALCRLALSALRSEIATPEEARHLPARNELERESGRRGEAPCVVAAPVAWIATTPQGNTLHMAVADGWKVEVVLSERGEPK